MISIFLVSCTFSVTEPVDLLWDKFGEKTDRLIIFLPGLLDSALTFEEKEFFGLARKAGIKADMVAMSIHFGHLMEDKMVERVELDVFLDAKKQGYKNIWIKKLEWIAEKGGMVLINTHPDYMNFAVQKCKRDEYPVSLYEDLLKYIKNKYEGQYWHVLAKDLANYWKNYSK